MDRKLKNPLRFVLMERWITITVIGSIFTFQFLTSFKMDLLDPVMDLVMPPELFQFLNVELQPSDGIPITPHPKTIFNLGNFFREFLKWCLSVLLLYYLAKFSPDYPDEPAGNPGAAIM
jgi:hypothetical protein